MKLLATAFGAILFASVPTWGQVTEVKLTLPVEPALSLGEDRRLAIAPFVIASSAEDEDSRSSRVDIQAEFQRYLNKQISREAESSVILIDETRLPGIDVESLIEDRGYWRDLGRRNGADLIMSGVIDFDIEDKVGYRTEEYVSPLDGRTYYRQVLIETTGFVFDIVILVFDGETGEKLVEENFRDFKQFAQRDFDEVLGLFENLRSLESQILGIFVPQETESTRYLFTP
ncbi:MAG: hypothetical protein R3338_00675 [Thermoanaerobaculia bacterium]|nr:hypothetical protein [Thermoanaerobaculia bacterium]